MLVDAIPVVLVGAYTSKLAEQLASFSCLPNGDFVIPGSASLWDKKLFFTVDMLVSKDASPWMARKPAQGYTIEAPAEAAGAKRFGPSP